VPVPECVRQSRAETAIERFGIPVGDILLLPATLVALRCEGQQLRLRIALVAQSPMFAANADLAGALPGKP
jgi:hypothetical protein